MATANDDSASDDIERDPHEPETDALPLSADDKAKIELRDHVYKIALAAAVLLMVTATIVYRIAEDWSWVDSFYFSAIAVTTVGFGDLSPTTDVTKLFTVFYIFVGISLLGAVLNEWLRRRGIHAGRRRQSRD